MTKLDELLQIDGVMAAGEFAPDGSIIGYRGNLESADAAECDAADPDAEAGGGEVGSDGE